jgi:hypothetical protein
LLAERIRSARLHRNTAWSAFLDSFGSEGVAVAHFERWQAMLLTLVDRLKPIVQAQSLWEATFR